MGTAPSVHFLATGMFNFDIHTGHFNKDKENVLTDFTKIGLQHFNK